CSLARFLEIRWQELLGQSLNCTIPTDRLEQRGVQASAQDTMLLQVRHFQILKSLKQLNRKRESQMNTSKLTPAGKGRLKKLSDKTYGLTRNFYSIQKY